jgi:hypothetical protein
MSFCFKPSRQPREAANILLLCHANNHNFKQLNTHLFTDKQAKINYETMCISDKPDIKTDITSNAQLPKQKYNIIVSVYCPSQVFFDDEGNLVETTFKNIHEMLLPNGIFIFSLPYSVDNLNIDGYTNECTEESIVDINKVVTKMRSLKQFVLLPTFTNNEDDGQGFFDPSSSTNSAQYYEKMKNIILQFSDFKLDFTKWSEWNDKRLIVVQKNTPQNGMGKSHTKRLHRTGEKVTTLKGPRTIYQGPRGGKYIKMVGKFIRIKV